MMSDSSFKNRNLLVLIFEILIILVTIGGLTFATSRMISGSNTIITFGEYNVDYIGDTKIVVDNLEPISDSMVNYDTYDDVIRLEFSLRGVEENGDEELIYDIMVNDMNIDCSLLNQYTKWNLYKNGELLYNGSFDPKFDGNVLTNNFRLTEIQQDLPMYDEDYDRYVLIIWISEACEDLSSCELVDQSGIVNSTMDMNVFIAVSGGEKMLYERIANYDATCVNKPVLDEGMIPVYYDDGNWRIADSTNGNVSRLWYNYGDARWANVVIVNTDKYDDAKIGEIIYAQDILAHYVWIPRFKYKIWNVGNTTNSYNAYENGIDIIFESGVNSSGIVCSSDICPIKENRYLTHPVFGDNLRGFWISKYEISSNNKFVPNVESLKNESLDSYKNIISNLSDVYNLGDTVDSHIINNLEWGATLYLSHSKYGVCVDNKCKNIGINDTYVSESNKQDTTTRNVYGVYDMAGATSEYVVGSTGFGTAVSEVLINDNETWYNGYYVNNQKDYVIRGGIQKGLFYTGDIGMFDVSTRGVLIIK